MSAVLLPFTADGDIDWFAAEAHIDRTVRAGLTPAVNMDTGYVQLLDDDQQTEVLERTAAIAGDGFVAGAYVPDQPGAAFDLDRYLAACDAIASRGGTPVIFPSHGLNSLDDEGWVAALAAVGDRVDGFVGFELGAMFVPYGRIPSLDAYEAMMAIGSCVGAKHSSLSRQMEWDRLELRDRVRPDFKVFTGNDLAIDMVMYGSDYLLGLSTFAPAEFVLVIACGPPATCASTNSTTCCSTSATSRFARRYPATATTPRCGSSCAARLHRAGLRTAHHSAPSRTEPCSPTSSTAWSSGHDRALRLCRTPDVTSSGR